MQARSRAIKVLDYAMSGPAGAAACETFVDALGLKILFSSFVGKANKKQKANAGHAASEDTAHTLGIVSSLLSNLASDSPARIRLLAKFAENSYEKPEKLLEIRDSAYTRLKATDKELAKEKKVWSLVVFVVDVFSLYLTANGGRRRRRRGNGGPVVPPTFRWGPFHPANSRLCPRVDCDGR